MWLSSALAQQVASILDPYFWSPGHGAGYPVLPPGAEESSLLEIGRLERRVGSVGVGVTSMWVHGRGLCYDCGDSERLVCQSVGAGVCISSCIALYLSQNRDM